VNVEETRARLVAAREAVEAAARLMETPRPEALDRSAGLLSSACEALAGSRDSLRGRRGDGGLLALAGRIREGAAETARVLEFAQRYHARRSQLMGVLTGGYGPGGDAAAVVRPGTMNMRG
jgi:hypothetical protein